MKIIPKSIFITGTSSGPGQATANLFLSLGYKVLGLHSGRNSTSNLFDELELDLSNPDNVTKLASSVFKYFGGAPKFVFLNAGLGQLSSVEDFPSNKARQMMEINFWAISDFIQSILPSYREAQAGHIIITGSVVADLHFPFKAHYSASKAALQAYVGSLDQEVREFGIKIHILEPGWMRSEFHNRLKPQETQVSQYKNRYKKFLDYKNDHNPKYPNGEDVAKVVLKIIQNPPKRLRIAVGPDSKWLNRLSALVGIPECQRWLVKKIS